MKKRCLSLAFFACFCLSVFGNSDELSVNPQSEITAVQEEVEFLLFMPNSGTQFADEEQTMVHLDNVASYLLGRNPGSGQIRVAGYSAIAANDIDSMALSMNRAHFVMSELQKRGIPIELFAEPVAYGEVDFWGSNMDENERSPNRRVRILLDGVILSPQTIPAPPPVIAEPPAAADPVAHDDEDGPGFPWFLLLLLGIPLIALLFFLAKKSRKKEPLAMDAPPAASVAPVTIAPVIIEPVVAAVISYTFVNLEEEIRFRAYELYLERGGWNENAYEDWCKAVIEVCARYEANSYETYSEDMNWWARRASKDNA